LPNFKLYNDWAIYVGTFLGGPLVAGYLAAENFKELGEPDKVRNTWIVAIGATILIFGSIFLIPNIEKIPNYIIPITYTLIAQFLVRRFQGAAIKNHIQNGGQVYSTWRSVWIGLVGLVVLLAAIFIILLFTNN